MVYTKKKKPSIQSEGSGGDEQDLGDIVRDDRIKEIESADNVSDKAKSVDNGKDDLGDFVRDDSMKSVHLGEDIKVGVNESLKEQRNDSMKQYGSLATAFCIPF